MFPGSLGPPELLVVMVLAVLLFGKRLPEVGRSLGKGITEFKKGLRGEDESPMSGSTDLATTVQNPPREEYHVPKFEPPTQPPIIDPAPPVAGN